MSIGLIPSWRRAISAVAATAGFLVAFPAASAHAAYNPQPFQVGNLNSRMCLEINGWSTANGGLADQWTCLLDAQVNPDANQAWQFIAVNGYYQIKNAYSGKCLEVQGWATGNGATVDQWDCLYDSAGNPDANQEWNLAGIYRITNVNSGKCLEVQGWSTSNGGKVDQWDCLNNSSGQPDANQQWNLAGPFNM